MVTFWGLGFLVFYGISYYGFQRMRHCQGSLLDMFTPGRYTPCAGTTDSGPGVAQQMEQRSIKSGGPDRFGNCPPGYIRVSGRGGGNMCIPDGSQQK